MLYTRKFLEDNKRENIGDLWFDGFFGTIPKAQSIKKNDKMNFIGILKTLL